MAEGSEQVGVQDGILEYGNLAKELQIFDTIEEIFIHLRKNKQDPTIVVCATAKDKAQAKNAIDTLQQLPFIRSIGDTQTSIHSPVFQPLIKEKKNYEDERIDIAIVFPQERGVEILPMSRAEQPPSTIKRREGVMVQISDSGIRIGRADYDKEYRKHMEVEWLINEYVRFVENPDDVSPVFTKRTAQSYSIMGAAFSVFNTHFTRIIPPINRDLAYQPGDRKRIDITQRRKKG